MARRAKGEVMEIGAHVQFIDRPHIHGTVTHLSKNCRFCGTDITNGERPFCGTGHIRRCQAGPWRVTFLQDSLWNEKDVYYGAEARDLELYRKVGQLTFGWF
jgi:hypothetical protein